MLQGLPIQSIMPSSHLSSITPELLSSLFVCSEKEAAKILGICLTTLKKACRRHGIDRWPYRKIKSSQLRESNSLRRSSSNSVRNPRQNSVSPPADYDSESSSQNSSNTVKLAHSHSTFKEEMTTEDSNFNSLANPPMYSFDDGDANHDGPMWMSAIEESSQKMASQQIEHQQHQQQYHQQQYQRQQQHYLIQQQSQLPQHQLLHHIGHILPSHGHFDQGVSDMEYSDRPVVYSRPIDATLYNF